MKFIKTFVDVVKGYIIQKQTDRMISKNKYEQTKKRAKRLIKLFYE